MKTLVTKEWPNIFVVNFILGTQILTNPLLNIAKIKTYYIKEN